MHDRIELRARRRVGEYERGDGLAIELAVRSNHGRAEGPCDLGEALGIFCDDLARETVGVDDGKPDLAKARCDRALSRRDAARETEEMHAKKSTSHAPHTSRSFAVQVRAMRGPAISRRKLLAGVGGALLGASAVVALLRTSGYDVPDEIAGALTSLEPWEYVLLQHAARRICAPDRPGDRSIPTADDTNVAGFADSYIRTMSADLRSDLKKLIALVEHLAPLPLGYRARFTKLDAVAQDRVLASLESNDVALLRGGFAGLKSLIFMGYYRDPRTWRMLGYDGPRVGRPVLGW